MLGNDIALYILYYMAHVLFKSLNCIYGLNPLRTDTNSYLSLSYVDIIIYICEYETLPDSITHGWLDRWWVRKIGYIRLI